MTIRGTCNTLGVSSVRNCDSRVSEGVTLKPLSCLSENDLYISDSLRRQFKVTEKFASKASSSYSSYNNMPSRQFMGEPYISSILNTPSIRPCLGK